MNDEIILQIADEVWRYIVLTSFSIAGLLSVKSLVETVILYLRLRMASLGYKSKVIWNGEVCIIDNISIFSVTLRSKDKTTYIPLEVWAKSPKTIPHSNEFE